LEGGILCGIFIDPSAICISYYVCRDSVVQEIVHNASQGDASIVWLSFADTYRQDTVLTEGW